jgi:hypothetical protein
LLATFYVTDTADYPAGLTSAHIEAQYSGTLRYALEQANANAGPDNIFFQIPASAAPWLNTPVPGFDPYTQSWRITLERPLPAVTDSVVIDGYSQAHAGVPYRYPAQFTFINEIQHLIVTGNPTSGTFQLRVPLVSGVSAGGLTAALPYNATAMQIQTEMERILGAGNVKATGGPVNESFVSMEFIGQLAGLPIDPLHSEAENFMGGLAPQVFLSNGAQGGVGEILEPVLIFSTRNELPALEGNNAKVRVILDGRNVTTPGFDIQAPHCEVRGFAIDNFDVGIAIDNRNAAGTRIQGNFLGQYLMYPVNVGTGGPLSGGNAVILEGVGNRIGIRIGREGGGIGAINATIGGTAPQENNVISGNLEQGILVEPGADGNVISGNQVGVIGPTDNGRYFQVGNGKSGVVIRSAVNSIGGSTSGAGNVISANGGNGIWISGEHAIGNVITGNIVGSAPGGGYVYGAGDPGNGSSGNPIEGQDGIRIEQAYGTQVGGPREGERNQIASNRGAGVRILGADASGTQIQNNFIGLLKNGTSVLGNRDSGVVLEQGVTRVVVGPHNIISGNLRGVHVVGPSSYGHEIIDNFIGTSLQGDADLGNTHEGILIANSSDNVIRGDGHGSQVISGNARGIVIGTGSSRNIIEGSYIGVSADASIIVGNSLQGILIEGASANQVGGVAWVAHNVIGGNLQGIEITGAGSTENKIEGNWIGTHGTTLGTLGNRLDGVRIRAGASGNFVGGADPLAGNVIKYNARNGIRVEDNSVRNTLWSNLIAQNRDLGIDLVGSLAAGDPKPNLMQSAPTMSRIFSTTTTTMVEGELRGQPNTAYTIQFFSGNGIGPGRPVQAAQYLGEVKLITDGTGFMRFTRGVSRVAEGEYVTATATDAAGNTSEFAVGVRELPAVVEFHASSYVVLESEGSIVIEVERTGGGGGDFTVDYRVVEIPGSASQATDFTGSAGTLSFTAGATRRVITIPILNDFVREGDETFEVVLSNPKGYATLGVITRTTVQIVDDDIPGAISFAQPEIRVDETAGEAIVTVKRNGTGSTVTVDYRAIAGTAVAGIDFTPVSGTLTFLPGETQQAFRVPILWDDVNDGEKRVQLRLSNPTGGATLGFPDAVPLVIQDVMTPRVLSLQAVMDPGGRSTSKLMITFNVPLDPIRAVDPRNYGHSVQIPGPDRRIGTFDDVLVGINSITYDPGTKSVTIRTVRGIPKGTPIRVSINAAENEPQAAVGVADTAGTPLDGDGDGRPGGAYYGVVVPAATPARVRGKPQVRNKR